MNDDTAQQKWDKFYSAREKATRWEGAKALALVWIPVAILGAAGAWALVVLFG